MDAFLARMDALPEGYGEGLFEGRRYGVTVRRSPDRRRQWLYGEALGGGGTHVSCNLYLLGGGRASLKPCEMPAEAVVAFVLGYRPFRTGDAPSTAPSPPSEGSR